MQYRGQPQPTCERLLGLLKIPEETQQYLQEETNHFLYVHIFKGSIYPYYCWHGKILPQEKKRTYFHLPCILCLAYLSLSLYIYLLNFTFGFLLLYSSHTKDMEVVYRCIFKSRKSIWLSFEQIYWCLFSYFLPLGKCNCAIPWATVILCKASQSSSSHVIF